MPSRKWMVVTAAAALGLAVVLVATYLARAALLRSILESELAALGFPEASVHVESVGFGGTALGDVVLDPELGPSVGRLEVRYHLGEIARGHVDAVIVEGLRLQLDLSGEGPLLGRLQPLLEGTGESAGQSAGDGGAGFPQLPPLEIRDAKVTLLTTAGPADATLQGSLEFGEEGGLGGRFQIALESDPATLHGDVDVRQAADGTIAADVHIEDGRVTVPDASAASLHGTASVTLKDQTPVAGAVDLAFADLVWHGIVVGGGTVKGSLDHDRIEAHVAMARDTGQHAIELHVAAVDPFAAPKLDLSARLTLRHDSDLWRLAPYPAPTGGEVSLALTSSGAVQDLSMPADLDAAVALFRGGGWTADGRLELRQVDYPRVGRGFTSVLSFTLQPGEPGLQLDASDGAAVTFSAIDAGLLARWKIPSWLAAVVLDGATFALAGQNAGPLRLSLETAGETVTARGDVSARLEPPRGEVRAEARAAAMVLQDFDLDTITLPDLDVVIDGAELLGQTIASARLKGFTEIKADGEVVHGILTAALPRVDAVGVEAADLGLTAPFSFVEDGWDIRTQLTGPTVFDASRISLPGTVDLTEPVHVEIAEGTLHIAPDDAMEFDAALRPGRLAADIAGVRLVSDTDSVRATGALSPDEVLHGQATLAGLALTVPAYDVAVEQAGGTVMLDAGEDEPFATLSIGAVRHTARPAMTGPLAVDAKVYRRGDRFDVEATASPDAGGVTLTVTGRYTPDSGSGRFEVVTSPIDFGPQLQPKALLPALEGLDKVSGRVEGRTRFDLKGGDLSGSGRLVLKDVGFQVGGTVVQGLQGTLQLSSLLPPRTPKDQILTVKSVDPGLPMQNMTIRLRLVQTKAGRVAVRIERLDAQTLGGAVIISDAVIEPAAKRHAINVQLSNLDLEALLRQIDLEGLSGTGRLSGMLPLAIEDGAVSIQDGGLAAQGGGVIRYRSDTAQEALKRGGEQVDLMMRALRDFRYDEFSTGVDMTEAGYVRLRLTMQGYNPAVLEGYPFRFNITLEGNAKPFLEALTESGRITGRLLSRDWLLRQ
jgi:hypothetical protein